MTDLRDSAPRIDRRIIAFLRRHSLTWLRIALGIVFLWFGALKVFDVSPVSTLVGSTVYFVDPEWFVPVLGAVEMTVGALLIIHRVLRIALLLLVGQMLGTFLVPFILPEVAFKDGNPLLLTVEGEFVAKNLVLLTAGLVVGSTVRPIGPRSSSCT